MTSTACQCPACLACPKTSFVLNNCFLYTLQASNGSLIRLWNPPQVPWLTRNTGVTPFRTASSVAWWWSFSGRKRWTMMILVIFRVSRIDFYWCPIWSFYASKKIQVALLLKEKEVWVNSLSTNVSLVLWAALEGKISWKLKKIYFIKNYSSHPNNLGNISKVWLYLRINLRKNKIKFKLIVALYNIC